MPISEWVSRRVFQFVHGNNLVYNTCWEDPRLDRQALNLSSADRLLVISSAGCNALDYLLADIWARYQKQNGRDVRFQVGTDEHGNKIAAKAQEASSMKKNPVRLSTAVLVRILEEAF